MMHSPYHLIPVTIIVLTGYFFTLGLTRIGLIRQTVHRKFWNTILLIAFLVTAAPGLLLVIRINYKLEWSFLDMMMKWHVDAGIALSLIAFFHVLWHLSYYTGLFRKTVAHPATLSEPVGAAFRPKPGKLVLPLLSLGFFGIAAQVLLIREITTVFQGNELMMAWTLGIWMFMTGLGSWFGKSWKKQVLNLIPGMIMILGYLPVAAVVIMNLTKNLFFLPGELVSPVWYLLIVTFLLAPVCLCTGFMFSLLVKIQEPGEKMFIRVYSLEAIGSVAGGIVVSFLMIRWFSIMESLLLTALIIHLVILLYSKNIRLVVSCVLLMLLFLFYTILPADLWLKSLIFKNQEVISTRETPFGNITICRNGDETSFYDNGNLLFSTGDMVVNEEYVHYAMLQHDHPEDVLLISGGIAGMAEEILKYPDVRTIDYVELNPGIIRMAEPFKPFPADRRISVVEGDGRKFISHGIKRYDIVILAIPDPSSLQINRYYTVDFFRLLKKRMKENAIVLLGISPAGNYLSPTQAAIESTIFRSVSSSFREIVVIPGERDFFIASDAPLSGKPGELVLRRGIRASYVNPDYLDDQTIAERSSQISEKISKSGKINSDMQPVPVFYHTLQYLSRFAGKNPGLLLLPLVLFLLPPFLMKPASSGMYVTGLTASSVEILLIFWFQTAFGNLYAAIGIIFAIFMGGLALGSAAAAKLFPGRRWHIILQLLLGLYVLLLPLLWSLKGLVQPGFIAWLIFIPVLLVPAFLTGLQYVVTTLSYASSRSYAASTIYASDLWGSSLGTILATFFLLPLAGVTTGCLILAGVNGLIALYMTIRK
jgi:spermidine synthase